MADNEATKYAPPKLTRLTGPKRKVESLADLPKDAEIVFASGMHRKVGLDGLLAIELWVMDSAGKHVQQITHNGYTHNHFAVSPKRNMIACNRYAGDTLKDGNLAAYDRKVLWVVDLGNREEWVLVPEMDAGWGGIDWTPDGEYIVCSMSESDLEIDDLGRTDLSKLAEPHPNRNQTDMFRIRPDGSGFQRITGGIEFTMGSEVPGHWVSDIGLAHDNEWFAMVLAVGDRAQAHRKSRIGICRMDGTGARFVSDGGPLPPGMRGPWPVGDFDPEWCPDGRYICCQRVTDVGYNWVLTTSDIARIDVETGEAVSLSPKGHKGTHYIPDWSQDNRVVCTEWLESDGYRGPVIINGDGTGYHRVEGTGAGTHYRWIPWLKK